MHGRIRDLGIAILSENLAFGGINRYCIDLVKGLQSDYGLTVSFLALGDKSDARLVQEAQNRKIEVQVIHATGVYNISFVTRLYRFLAERGVKLLHSQGYRSNIISRLAVRMGRLPVRLISTVHGAYHFKTAPLKSKLYYVADYLSMFESDRVIAVSAATQEQVARWVPKGKLTVIHNGTVLHPIFDQQEKMARRHNLGLPGEAKIIAFVGRLSPQKGIAALVNVAQKMLAITSDVVFLVVGDGPLRPMIEACVREFKTRIHWLGEQRCVTPFYQAADVVFMPSRTDGLPMVLLEAFAHGLPAVASSVGGVPEVLVDGYNGFLCNPDDTDDMCVRLLQLTSDDEMRRKMGIQARSTVQANFSVSSMVERTYHEYQNLLGY